MEKAFFFDYATREWSEPQVQHRSARAEGNLLDRMLYGGAIGACPEGSPTPAGFHCIHLIGGGLFDISRIREGGHIEELVSVLQPTPTTDLIRASGNGSLLISEVFSWSSDPETLVGCTSGIKPSAIMLGGNIYATGGSTTDLNSAQTTRNFVCVFNPIKGTLRKLTSLLPYDVGLGSLHTGTKLPPTLTAWNTSIAKCCIVSLFCALCVYTRT